MYAEEAAVVETTDFLVDVGNPAALDQTLQALSMLRAFVIGGPKGPFLQEDDHYIVRVFGGDTANSMFEYMMKSQGYCTVVGRSHEKPLL